MVRSLLGGGQDDTVARRYRRAEIERGEAEAIQVNGDPEGGSTATIERGEAEAIQVNGDPEGGSTATIEGGEAEAIQVSGDPKGGQYGDNRERKEGGG